MSKVERVGVVSRPDRIEALKLANKICDYLRSKKLEVLMERAIASFRKEEGRGVEIKEMNVDLFVVVGGDGTILLTSSMMPDPEIPILTINVGTKGLIAEVLPDRALEAIDRCLRGDYLVEECMKIASSINGIPLPDALNEVLITSARHLKMLHFELTIDEGPPISCFADGVMVSTPLGSTAHSFSAGGSILDPNLNAFIITTICPLGPFRSIVIPSTSVVKVKIMKPELEGSIIIDGIYRRSLTIDDVITLRKSRYKTTFVRFDPDFFYRRLGRKITF